MAGRASQEGKAVRRNRCEYCPIVITTFGSWLIVVGIFGLATFCKRTRLGVGFYAFMLCVTACVLIALAGVGLSISLRLYEALGKAESCKDNGYLA